MLKTMVMIPTYNEKGNIGNLIQDILNVAPAASVPLEPMGLPRMANESCRGQSGLSVSPPGACPASVVVVDDDSPDGTSQLVESIKQKNPRVHLLTRKNRKGRGTAGIEGFLYALDWGADLVVEMDGDYSHHPRHIPELVDAMRDCDVAIGSRAVAGGGETGRGLARQGITRFANLFIQAVMGIPVQDCTSGFRCFKREVLQSIGLERMVSVGPSIVEEMLYACHLRGYKLKEIPIRFEDRVKGESTKTLGQFADTLFKILQFRWTLKARLEKINNESRG